MTGVWGLGYRVSPASDIVLLSNGNTSRDSNPDHLWLFILMTHGERDVEAEQRIQADRRLAEKIECRDVGKECILGIREKYFEELLGILTKGAA